MLHAPQGCCRTNVSEAAIKVSHTELANIPLNSAQPIHCSILSFNWQPLVHLTPFNPSRLSLSRTYSKNLPYTPALTPKEQSIRLSSVSLQQLIHVSVVRLVAC